MSTYLQLCQKVARESGTISGTSPTAVTSQTGRLLDIVNFTQDAWLQIQNSRNAWAWMRKEYSSSLTSGTAKYTAASFGITDFATWITEEDSLSMYLTASGVADEGELKFITWSLWRQRYSRGTQTNNRPTVVAVSPANELCFGAVPDDAYTVNGEYFQTAQVMSANTDEPNMPARFHDLIVHKALILLGMYDEEDNVVVRAQLRYREMLYDLERDQLPAMTDGQTRANDPLA